MRHLRQLSAIALTLACASPVVAQETVGTLVGTVSDKKTGKPLAGTKILVRSPKLLADRTAVTGEDGNFRIPLLPNGEYTLTTVKDGYATGTARCGVSPGQVIRQNVRLTTVEEQSATVVVIADMAAQIDKTQTDSSTTFTSEKLSMLTSTGDLLAIANIAPGVALGSNDHGTTINIRGGNSVGGRFLVNGMNVGDPGWGDFRADQVMVADMIESVAVVQSPLNARYGNTESGLVSYVTTHGSNEFKGSLKAFYGRSTLSGTPTDTNARQTYRYGGDPSAHQIFPGTDDISRRFEATFSGPIWKDHITFAWGGRFAPSTFTDNIISRDWQNTAGGGNVISHDYSTTLGGTLYQLPGGAEIRRGNFYDQGKHYGSSSNSSFNQYALFFQLSQDHTLEWSFSQSENTSTGLLGGSSLANYGSTGEKATLWNLAYKGVYGNSVLEARLAHSSANTIVPPNNGTPFVSSNSFGTWNNEHYTSGTGNIPGTTFGTNDYPYTNLMEAWKLEQNIGSSSVMGSSLDQGDKRGNTSLYVNLQSFWGAHQVDVGLNYERSDWDTSPGRAPFSVNVPGGQIATDLTSNDILYPAGYTGAQYNPADYAGKWVMWAAHATYLDLWPGSTYPAGELAGKPYVYQWAPKIPMATMTRYSGKDQGTFNQPTTSLYANDLWTLSPNLAVMGGLRFDRFELKDDRGTVFAYNMLTPRFQIKWDPSGDQKRLISYSFGRFHNRIPSAMYMAFVHRRHDTRTSYSWDPTVDGMAFDESNPSAHPLQSTGYQLVSTAQLTNPANYTYFNSMWSPAMTSLDPNFKAEYNDEHVVKFERAYEGGSKLSFAVVRRDWRNNYLWFADPYRFAVTDPVTSRQVETYHSTLRNDSALYHNYTAAEIEWDLKLSKRFSFAGNYTYSRNAQNQQYWSASSELRPGNIGATGYGWGMRWSDLWSRFGYSTLDTTEPNTVVNQVTNFWLTCDLSRGGIKSSLIFLGTYQTGTTYTQQEGWSIDPSSDIYKSVMSQAPSNYVNWNQISKGYGDRFYMAARGTSVGGFQNPDWFDLRMKYNLDVPLAMGVRWTLSLEVTNILNHTWTGDLVSGLGWSYDQGYNVIGSNQYNRNGYLMDPAKLRNPGPSWNGLGARSVVVETGIKF